MFVSIAVFAQNPSGQAFKEYDLKAAFLFNFSEFVDWPPDAFATPASALVIGVLGDDPFGKTLDALVADEIVNGRKIVVQRYRRLGEVFGCQILFLSRSEQDRLSQILSALEGRSILTVGETTAFVRQGGIVALRTEGNRIRLTINVGAAKAARLTLSSKVLRTAELVDVTGQ
jgi:hypothetical protein